MKSILKIQSIALVFLLLCSVCVLPVVAEGQKSVVRDGVHLLQFSDVPTMLDDGYYNTLKQTESFVVDGNQFYWVRIGSVVSKGLTTVWWAIWLSIMIFSLFCGFFAWYWSQGIPRFFPDALPKTIIDTRSRFKIRMTYSIPLICIGLILYFTMISGILPNTFTHAVCGDYMDIQASDDTILLKVDKIHPETNQLYMKSGVNLTVLTHLSGSGNILTATGVKPI